VSQEYLSRQGNKQEEPAWHVFYVNDVEPQPQFRRCGTFDAVIKFLRGLPVGTFAVPVFGLPAYYNRVRNPTDRRYLVHPNGKIVPLFDAIEEIEIDNSFMLGDPDLDITPVTTAALTNNGRPPSSPGARATFLAEDDIEEEEDPELDADIPIL
jgi:hypothetical protein